MKKLYSSAKAILAIATIALCATTASARATWASYKSMWYKLDTVNNTAQLYSVQNDTTGVSTPATFSVGGVTYTITSIAPHFASQKGYGSNVTAYDPTTITGISLSANITEIGEYAFAGCSSATYCTMSTGVVTIGKCAFKGCSKIARFGNATSGTGLKELTTVGDSAFYGCSSAGTFVFNTKVANLGKDIFKGCDKLKLYWSTDAVPESYFYTEAEGFKNPLDGLTQVQFYTGCTTIPKGFMYGNKSLITINSFSNVTTVGDYAFYGCPALVSNKYYTVTLGNKFTTIGKYAFAQNKAVKGLTIKNAVTSVGEGAFEGCDGLLTVSIEVVDSAAIPTTFGNLIFGTSATDKPYQAVLSTKVGYEELYAQATGTKWFTKQLTQAYTNRNGGIASLKVGAPYNYQFSTQLLGVKSMAGYLLLRDNSYYINPDVIDTNTQQAYPYLADFATKDAYEQCTWIIVTNVPNADYCVGKKLSAGNGTLTGTLTDNVNPVIKYVPGLKFNSANSYAPFDTITASGTTSYELNAYIPASFTKQATYFFVQPKPCELAQVKWALYNNGYCSMPDKGTKVGDIEDVNPLGLSGSFQVIGTYLPSDQQLKDGNIYTLNGIALKANDPYLATAFKAPAAKAGATTTPDYYFVPFEVVSETEGPNTAVSDVTSAKTVKAVRYYDLAGHTSAQPFEGVNVVVTTYTDGTTATAKSIK